MNDDKALKSQVATSSDRPRSEQPSPKRAVYLIRGVPVVIDADVARLFGVETRHLNEQAKRNDNRFCDDFCLPLSPDEAADVMSQIATSTSGAQTSPEELRAAPVLDPNLDVDPCRPPDLRSRLREAFSASFSDSPALR